MFRYVPDEEEEDKSGEFRYKSGQMMKTNNQTFALREYFRQILNSKRLTQASDLTSSLVNYATLSFCKFTLMTVT